MADMKNYQSSVECNEYSLMKEVLTHGPRVMACVHRRLEIYVFILFTCARKKCPTTEWLGKNPHGEGANCAILPRCYRASCNDTVILDDTPASRRLTRSMQQCYFIQLNKIIKSKFLLFNAGLKWVLCKSIEYVCFIKLGWR